MQEIQRFALEHIYCAPSQDYQYRFSLVRATKNGYPVKRTVTIYNDVKQLPNNTSRFHIYVAGNIPVALLNLLRKNKNWLRDKWYNLEEDMNERNIIIQVYDQEGKTIPRKNIYYTCTHNDGLIFAIEVNHLIERLFAIETPCYVRFYSNEYFSTDVFRNSSGSVGIYCESKLVLSNQDKVSIQNKIQALESKGGKTLVYIDGYYSDSVSLHIPIDSLVEIVYDNSIVSKERYSINSLRTFDSVKHNKLKYLLYRNRILDSIQYEDDTEVYVTGQDGYLIKGLYYYQHKEYSFSNVTDKDFSIYTSFVNNQAQLLSDLIGGGLQDKSITLLTRKSSSNRKLIYNSLKLHELYKLPNNTQYEVMSNTGYTLHELRAEQLENSDYFKIAGASSLKEVTKELATSAVGYNGINYYHAKTPEKITSGNSVNVPILYQKESIAYEYSSSGKLLRYKDSVGPIYTAETDCRFVEFIQGKVSNYPYALYKTKEDIPLLESEFRVLMAQYEGINRISVWEDITDSPLCSYKNNTVNVNDSSLKRVRIFYFNRPLIKDLELPFVDGTLNFPITVWEDRGDGYQNYLLDLPYDSIEIYLNGNRLTCDVDYLIDFPYAGICSKKHIDYSLEKQNIHLRLTGYNLDKEKINQREIRGFVSHGVLTRNNYYDIRDDKVFSAFIDGKLVDNSQIKYSEDDSVLRVNDTLNGLPYSMIEHMVSIKDITNLSTLQYFNTNLELNKKLSDLYNIIYPEPKVPPFNVIQDHYYLFSVTVSKIIHDLIDGNIPPSLYTNPYNDTIINNLLSTTYKREMKLDPIRLDLPINTVEIHPHFGNDVISVNIYQYRFISNVVRIITKGKPELINLSGYLEINNETVEVIPRELAKPGGIVIL